MNEAKNEGMKCDQTYIILKGIKKFSHKLYFRSDS